MTGDTLIDYQNFPDAPVPGAAKIWWRIDGQWVEKGWLMPTIGNTLREGRDH